MKADVKIKEAQQAMMDQHIDGWLLYDFHGMNDLAREFLHIPQEEHLTRRFFYWIPAKGEPLKIVHAIEPHALDHLPGKKEIYLKWQTLEEILKSTLKGIKSTAMEYSPKNAVPYVSKVDGGIIDLIRDCGTTVVSSASFIQNFTCLLDDEQLITHLEAAQVLDDTVSRAWDVISSALKEGRTLTEYDMQQWILREFDKRGCVTSGTPICAVNAHAADPHYYPQEKSSSAIKKGDFILIDIWCKKKTPRAIFADICRVGVAAKEPTSRQNEIFQIVRKAQKEATDFLQRRYSSGKEVKGWEVDAVSRKVIVDAGYGEFFTHRTGHNIYTHSHGPGANLDSLETMDVRPLIPRMCFSVEPGIYIPEELGVRLEHDVYISPESGIQITGGFQDEIKTLL